MYLLHNWKIEACNYACIKCWHVVKICLEHLSHSFCFSYKPFCFQVFLHYTQAFPVFAKICLFKISVHVCKRCCCEHSGAYTFLNYGLFYLVHCSDLNSKENQKGGDRYICVCEVTQSCPTLCNPMDCSPPGSSVRGILQARILEWVAISFSNACKRKVEVKSLSRVRLLATPWTAAHQAPPPMGFSRREYWSGVPLPSPYQV